MSDPLPQEELRTGDAHARRIAVAEFEKPLMVEAGAGTGKTTTLVARIAAWCTGAGWLEAEKDHADEAGDVAAIARRVLSGVLAITFTEAATADMGAKIRVAFARLSAGETIDGLSDGDLSAEQAPRMQERASALRAALDAPIVLTIHGWCQRLLAEHPLEAGLDPAFVVDAEGTLAADAAREVLEERLARALTSPPDPDWLLLASRRVGLEEIQSGVLKLLQDGRRAEDLEFDPLEPEKIEPLFQELARSARELCRVAGPLLTPAGTRSKLTLATLEAAASTHTLLAKKRGSKPAELQPICDALSEAWPDNVKKRLKLWAAGQFNRTEANLVLGREPAIIELASACEAARAPLQHLDPMLLDAARRVLSGLLAETRRRHVARGIQTFSDLLRDARQLLEKNDDVRERVRGRLRQLLVDEFQDTDPTQCALVRELALTPSAGARRVGLFIVGDPKQSIYGWRQADLSAYESFLREVEAAGGERLRLSLNFRSTERILREVDRWIAPVMKAESGVQPRFEALVSSRAVEGDDVEHWISWELSRSATKVRGETPSDLACRIEARRVACDIHARRGSHGAWSDCAILMRTTSSLEIYLEALREAGVPFEVAGDKSYYRRREIIDAAALVRVVCDPSNAIALVTLLRSTCVGVPDAALTPLWCEGFPSLMSDDFHRTQASFDALGAAVKRAVAQVPTGIPGIERIAGWEKNLALALEHIGALRRSLEDDPSDVFVEKLRTLFLIEAAESARWLGAFRQANLERFFRRLSEAFEARAGDESAILRALATTLADARDAQEARPKDAHRDAVQVMTIHKAKGLDFDTVYLVGLHKKTQKSGLPVVGVGEIDGQRARAFFGAASPGYERLQARARATVDAERVRTLYVAMTRPKNRLVLCGAWPDSIAAIPLEKCDAHIDLLLTSAPNGLETELARAAPGDVIELEGARFSLPTAESEQPTRSPAAPSPPIDAARMRADSLSLAALGRAAAQRSARPWSGFPSEAHEEPDFDESGAERDGNRAHVARDAALLAGTLVHAALESFDAQADPASEIERLILAMERHLPAGNAASTERSALESARATLKRFENSHSCQRLRAIGAGILARELPVLIAPAESDAAVGCIRGAIDLLYRDPEDGSLVIADYKTDAVSDEAGLAVQADRYRAQGKLYQRALAEALDLAQEPRFELWFLAADRILVAN